MTSRPRIGARALAAAALSLAVATVVAFVALLTALTPLRPVWYLGALALAVALAVAAIWRARQWVTFTALAVTALLLGAATFFHFVVMGVPTSRTAFVVGQPAPEFSLPDSLGRPVTLGEFRGRKPVVLVFYRGYW